MTVHALLWSLLSLTPVSRGISRYPEDLNYIVDRLCPFVPAAPSDKVQAWVVSKPVTWFSRPPSGDEGRHGYALKGCSSVAPIYSPICDPV